MGGTLSSIVPHSSNPSLILFLWSAPFPILFHTLIEKSSHIQVQVHHLQEGGNEKYPSKAVSDLPTTGVTIVTMKRERGSERRSGRKTRVRFAELGLLVQAGTWLSCVSSRIVRLSSAVLTHTVVSRPSSLLFSLASASPLRFSASFFIDRRTNNYKFLHSTSLD